MLLLSEGGRAVLPRRYRATLRPIWFFQTCLVFAVQVVGFGKPPKEYPWASATATRCDEQGQSNPQGDHVQFHVVNIAGKFSSELHNAKDKPLGATGPERSMIQVFQWIEPIKTCFA